MTALARNDRWRRPTLVDPTIKKIAIVFRILGLVWMALLVVFGLAADEGTRTYIGQPWVAVVAFTLAAVWTLVTPWAARNDRRFRSAWFIITDWVVAMTVGVASALAGTEDVFHGGYPMSWVVVAAAAGGFRWAFPGAMLLGLEQFLVRIAIGRTASGAAFAIVFPFMAVVAGWGFDALRDHSAKRSEAEARLARAEADKARLEERAELANRLHDSVLQTLHAIRLEVSDPQQVTYLARRQERELKRTIEQFLSPYEDSFRVALLTARDDVEDLHGVAIDALVKDDLPLEPNLAVVIDAAREAMVNAARHSGSKTIDVYAEASDGAVLITVRDRGSGFDPEEALGSGGHGLEQSLVARVENVGGTVEIDSTPGTGTEVRIRIQLDDSM